MSKQLVIVGTGLFAEVAASYFSKHSPYEVVAFACHQKYKEDDTLLDVPLVAIEELHNSYSPSEVDVFVAIGYRKMNKIRQEVYLELKKQDYRFATFIHPNVEIWDSSQIGENVFIFEDNTIQPFTQIGDNSILWSGNHLGHHSSIGNHCFISSHVVISGSCHVGNNIFMGVNATLRDGITIADETLIGANALIMQDTQPREVFIASRTRSYPKASNELDF